MKVRRDTWILSGAPGDAEQYVAAVASLFAVTLADGASGFHNTLDGLHFGEVALGRCHGVPQRFRRTEEHIGRDGMDSVQVILELSGEGAADYDGRKVSVGPGDIRVIDMARPFDAVTGPYETLNLMIPRARLGGAAERDFHGLVPPQDAPGVRLLRGHLTSLWAVADDLTVADGLAASRVLTALVAAVIERHAPPGPPRRRAPASDLLAQARALVDADPADRELTPREFQHRLSLSRSSLYRLFAPHGGVGAFIMGRRLDLAFLAVADPADARSIEALALAHGFHSHAHFGRAFRARFGVRPGELRGYRRAEPSAPAADPQGVMDWLRDL